jgi:two-component system OmpR family response regulator
MLSAHPPATRAARTQQTVLIVDDDPAIRGFLAKLLETAGYAVLKAANGSEMFEALAENAVNLVILDPNLPGEDGLSLCRQSRSRSNIPIIMLSARGEAIDRVIGLEVGADDYLAKPFEPRELVARVRSVMRRTCVSLVAAEPAAAKKATFRGWTLDFENRRLTDGQDRVVVVTGTEFSLLKLFVEHPNEVLTREQLLTAASHAAVVDDSGQRADVQISRLRHKLQDNGRNSELIMTVRGQGYVLAAAVNFE